MYSSLIRTCSYAVFFIAWVGFSFFTHKLAKHYFQSVLDEDNLVLSQLIVAVMLVTGVQLLCCGLLALAKAPEQDIKNFKDKKISVKVLLMVATPHMLGTLLTNYSMALIPAASTHLIKILEPMSTAGMAWLIVGASFSLNKLLSFAVVLIGAVGACWDPDNTLPTYRLGMHLAMLSNLFYGARNVTMEHLYGRIVFGRAVLGKMSLLGAVVLLPICIVLQMLVVALQFNTVTLAILGGSALCYATYIYISTCDVLHCMRVVSHTFPKMAKQVVVIILLFMFSQRQYLSPAFFVVCCIGLLLYTTSHKKLDHTAPDVATSIFPCKPQHSMTVVLFMVIFITVGVQVTGNLTESSTGRLNVLPNINDKYMLSNSVITSERLIDHQNSKDHTNLSPPALTDPIPERLVDYQNSIDHTNLSPPALTDPIPERLVDHPNTTDITIKFMLNASSAVHEAQRIQLQIYKELIGHYKKAILVSLPDHPNKGDHAITVGELQALDKLGIELIYSCPTESCGNFEKAKKVVDMETDPVVVLATGGGNFCIYKTSCRLRERLVMAFPDREVLIFPQSVQFSNKKEMVAHARIMNKHKNLTYLFRDRRSYNIIVDSEIFEYNKAVLCPDAAMQIGVVKPSISPTHDVVWMKRNDIESRHYSPKIPKNLTVIYEDWYYTKSPRAKNESQKEMAYNMFHTAVKFLSRGRVVITERLHGHIVSVLLGLPNVILDNSYKKLTSYHDTWTPNVDNVLVASNATDAIVKAQYLLDKYY